ncbi:MAG: hypothetical protein ILNGONEN_02146 [Syntrophorhabdaceae bacterium]|nr:hypothetical protein [Syntrophorhabdaceae bacterium]
MAKKIAMFNHQGGVSKTTTTFNLGWMLASKGKKVVLVDADPQCNLTGLVLEEFGSTEDFESFYQQSQDRNIRASLAPAFESQPRRIEAIECVKVKGISGLLLIPGHISLSEYEVTLGIAQGLTGSLQVLQNLPGSLSHFIDLTAEKNQADYVFIDMNPSLGSINQNLLMTSDYFILPTAPDYFSIMAINSLLTVFPRWHAWSEKAKSIPALRNAVYPFPQTTPKFLGTVIQKFRHRKGEATTGFQTWIDQINKIVSEKFVPLLSKKEMALSVSKYNKVNLDYKNTYCLSQIPDFNTLIATSQRYRTPVFALTDEMLGHVGSVLEQDRLKRDEFKRIFNEIANRIITLTENEAGD